MKLVAGSRGLRTLSNGALVALGLCVMSGWILRVPVMVLLEAGSVPLVFNTGLNFMLSGVAAGLLGRCGAFATAARRAAALAVLVIAAITLSELALDRSLWVDLAPLHLWFDYGNTRPGRMAPNTALGFLGVACVVLLAERVDSKRRALLVVASTFAVLGIGLTGLVGYAIAPDLLFGWARSARMAVPTALGMIACACSLALGWVDQDWYASRRFFREDEKIRLLGGATVFVATITAGLTGFVLLQSTLTRNLEQSLQTIVSNRRPWLHAIFRELTLQSKASSNCRESTKRQGPRCWRRTRKPPGGCASSANGSWAMRFTASRSRMPPGRSCTPSAVSRRRMASPPRWNPQDPARWSGTMPWRYATASI